MSRASTRCGGAGVRDGRGYGPYGTGYWQEAGRYFPLGPNCERLSESYDFQPDPNGNFIHRRPPLLQVFGGSLAASETSVEEKQIDNLLKAIDLALVHVAAKFNSADPASADVYPTVPAAELFRLVLFLEMTYWDVWMAARNDVGFFPARFDELFERTSRGVNRAHDALHVTALSRQLRDAKAAKEPFVKIPGFKSAILNLLAEIDSSLFALRDALVLRSPFLSGLVIKLAAPAIALSALADTIAQLRAAADGIQAATDQARLTTLPAVEQTAQQAQKSLNVAKTAVAVGAGAFVFAIGATLFARRKHA